MKRIIYKYLKAKQVLGFLIVSIFTMLLPAFGEGRELTEQEVQAAVQTWVRNVTADARPDAVIEKLEPYQVDGRTFAYIAHIAGGGFSLCGANDSLTLPVYLYSPSGRYEPENPGFQSVLETIVEVTIKLEKLIESNDPQLQEYSADLDLRASLWQDLLTGRLPLPKALIAPLAVSQPQQMTLPLTTSWDQNAPYNNLAPNGDGGRSVVGCAATSMAQIMRYWQWPPSGVGSSSYTWNGDQSCGGNVGGGVLSANYSDSYDWQNMPDNCTGGCTAAEQNALAELSYEIGVSVEMDYGRCESSTPMYNFVTGSSPLINNFRYDSDATYNSDSSPPLTDDGTIITEIQWLRPVEIGGCLNAGGTAHYWVALGYNDSTNPPQFLMNMGWGGVNTWNTWDGVANSCHNYITQIAPADTVRFVGNTAAGDGSPDNPHQNIEEAIQQAPDNATLVFKAGSVNTFSASSLVINKSLTLKGKDVTIQ
jgi:hypothetical protein